MSEGKVIVKKDEFNDDYYLKEINMKIFFCTYDENIIKKNIEKMIFEVLTDKAFDGIGWFEKYNKD